MSQKVCDPQINSSQFPLFVTFSALLYTLSIQTASEFMSQYHDHLERDINKDINLASYINVDDFFIYSYSCHEGTLAFAYALNKTIAGKCIVCYTCIH